VAHARGPIDRSFIATLAAFTLGFVLVGMPTAQAASKPTVSSFTPACGPVGTSVTILGDHFTGATRVEFNGVDQTTLNVESDGKITTTVPTGATTGKIAVTNPDGTGTSVDDFTVSSSCDPGVTGFSPMSGPVGTSVTINGTRFVNTSAVKFNGTNASQFSWNPSGTKLTTTVPSGATTGKISVTTPAGTATSSNNFTVTGAGALPTITSFSPTSGPIGTSVTINGTNFTGASQVRFNQTAAASFSVNSAGTRITTKVPSGATTGKISVTTPAGTATSSNNFTVTGLPTITSFSPTSGPIGTSVTINGTNFTGASQVRFNQTAAASFSVNSAGTRITTKVPSGATTGKISVTTPAGTAASSDSFTVQKAFHDRSVSLELRRHLVARGFVSAEGGFAACYQNVAVAIQRKVEGIWRTIRSTLTDSSGFYRRFIPDREGRYRALVKGVELTNDICGRAVSPVRFNT
jgi:hypothetical protein